MLVAMICPLSFIFNNNKSKKAWVIALLHEHNERNNEKLFFANNSQKSNSATLHKQLTGTTPSWHFQQKP